LEDVRVIEDVEVREKSVQLKM